MSRVDSYCLPSIASTTVSLLKLSQLGLFEDPDTGLPVFCRWSYGWFGPISVAGLSSSKTYLDCRDEV